jgi:hypothetical protein
MRGKLAFTSGAAGIMVLLLAASAHAQTPTTPTAQWDGIYPGVSWAQVAGGSNCDSNHGPPHQLEIRDGHIDENWGNLRVTGDIGSDGKGQARTSLGGHLLITVNENGAQASYMGGQTCGYKLVWGRKG